MSDDGFRFEPYEARGGREWMLVRGTSSGPQVILIAPLFEELNFTRTLLNQIGRGLARHGIATWLPDLPGTGESERPLASIGWDDWRDGARAAGEAVAARTACRPFSCALRGGALLDDAVAAAGRWRYASVAGEPLLRRLRRAQLVSDREAGTATVDDGAIVELAGYPLSRDLREGLARAVPAPIADRDVPAAADDVPWRRAEPAGNVALANRLVTDIRDWLAACASC